MGPRRKAREYALQMLFQWDITHDQHRADRRDFFPESARRKRGDRWHFARAPCTGTIEHVEEIDRSDPASCRALAAGSNGCRRSQLLRLGDSGIHVSTRRRRKPSSSTRPSRSHDASARRNPRNSSTAFWTASRRNWKANGPTRTDSYSKAEADPGAWLRSLSDLLPEHAHPGRCSEAFRRKTAEDLEHNQVKVRVSGRILTNRPFGKAGFITLSDGEGQLAGLCQEGSASRARLPAVQAARHRRLHRRRRHSVPHAHRRTDGARQRDDVSGQVFSAPAGEMARFERLEIRYRQRYVDLVVESGSAGCFRQAQPDHS